MFCNKSELATVEFHACHLMFLKEILNCLKFPVVAARRPFKGDNTPNFRNFLSDCFGSIKQLFKQRNMCLDPITGFLAS